MKSGLWLLCRVLSIVFGVCIEARAVLACKVAVTINDRFRKRLFKRGNQLFQCGALFRGACVGTLEVTV